MRRFLFINQYGFIQDFTFRASATSALRPCFLDCDKSNTKYRQSTHRQRSSQAKTCTTLSNKEQYSICAKAFSCRQRSVRVAEWMGSYIVECSITHPWGRHAYAKICVDWSSGQVPVFATCADRRAGPRKLLQRCDRKCEAEVDSAAAREQLHDNMGEHRIGILFCHKNNTRKTLPDTHFFLSSIANLESRDRCRSKTLILQLSTALTRRPFLERVADVETCQWGFVLAFAQKYGHFGSFNPFLLLS